MGNDGGSIPKRRELVRSAARPPTSSEQRATALESLAHAWSTCALSGAPLDPAATTASDARGRLYDYETVLRCLMPAATQAESSISSSDAMVSEEQQQLALELSTRCGVRSLRDVVRLRFFTLRRGGREEYGSRKKKTTETSTTTANGNGEEVVRACPVSLKELGAATRAVYVVPCGHVFAEAAMREVAGTAADKKKKTAAEKEKKEEKEEEEEGAGKRSACPECSEPFEARDVVPVLPVDEADVERCSRRIEELRALGLTHSLKKDKGAGGKKKRKAAAVAAAAEAGDDGKAAAAAANGEAKKAKKKNSNQGGDISSRINNAMTASLTAKVLAEQEERNKRRKMVGAVR
ncbi:Rtf2 RING-finger-domain-containing protein [Xylariaceae sp. FL0804]|nr:Rtf2 RING-finger-domain-containing protein [Xylariaceae sp. FL0804]